MSKLDFHRFAGAALLLTGLAVAAPAAALTTFAQFNQETETSFASFVDLGAAGATLSVGPETVLFDILAFGPLGTYELTMTGAATTDQPLSVFAGIGTRGGWDGVISFTDGGTNYLTATFTDATLVGLIGGTSAAFLASTPGSSITFTSDVINLAGYLVKGISIGVSGLDPAFGSGTGEYSGELTGGFAAGVIPEPATWALMVAGFGLVGFAVRRARIGAAAA